MISMGEFAAISCGITCMCIRYSFLCTESLSNIIFYRQYEKTLVAPHSVFATTLLWSSIDDKIEINFRFEVNIVLFFYCELIWKFQLPTNRKKNVEFHRGLIFKIIYSNSFFLSETQVKITQKKWYDLLSLQTKKTFLKRKSSLKRGKLLYVGFFLW